MSFKSTQRYLLLMALFFVISKGTYVANYDSRCFACVEDKYDANDYYYCIADNRCYNSINDTCSDLMAENGYQCQ